MLCGGVDHLSGRESVLLCSRDSLAKLKLDPSWDRDRPSVFFCIGLSPSQIKQSGFLEGVSGTAGVTELPQDISQDDFLLWLKHCCPPFRPPPANEKVARLINVRLLLALDLLLSCRHARSRQSAYKANLVSCHDRPEFVPEHQLLRLKTGIYIRNRT